MPAIHYQRWDVFTNRVFSGNQLAVITDADGLDAETMQRVANEFSLPETAFVLQPTNPACDFRLRIFTPARELPFAGHPTIGTTFALVHTGKLRSRSSRIVLELGIGPSAVDLDWRDAALEMAWMSQRAPEFGPRSADTSRLSAILGVSACEFLSPELPVQILSSGLALLFAPLRSRAAVDRVSLNRAALVELCAALGVAECPVYVFTLEAGADGATTYSRMFAPVFGIAEDPATGGASGPLAAYLGRYCPRAIPESGPILNLQGVAMGRPGRIFMSLAPHAGAAAALRVGGEAVFIGSGTLLC